MRYLAGIENVKILNQMSKVNELKRKNMIQERIIRKPVAATNYRNNALYNDRLI